MFNVESLYSFPYWTFILGFLTFVCVILVACAKDSELRVISMCFATLGFCCTGLGMLYNIHELVRNVHELHDQLKWSNGKIDQLSKEADAYERAFDSVVQVVLTTPRDSKDAGDHVFPTLVMSLPQDYPAITITRFCKDRNSIRFALDPMMTLGTVKASQRPAWDALINCAYTNSGH